MISLLQLSDKSGKNYSPGKLLIALDNGVKLYENTEDDSEVIVWLPEVLRPHKFELRCMCNEIIIDAKMKTFLMWPEKPVYNNSDNECCGYIAKKPDFQGELSPLNQFIEKKRSFDKEEKLNNVVIGLNIARIFKSIKDMKHGYTLGIISPESFWVDEAFNVYFMEAYNCARNIDDNVKSCYVAPELLMYDSWKGHFNAQSDVFLYALILFQVLTGRFPYGSSQNVEKSDVEHIWNLICDGVSVFYDKTDDYSVTIVNELNLYSERLSKLFQLVFGYCGWTDYTQKRPMIEAWMEALSAYITMIDTGAING